MPPKTLGVDARATGMIEKTNDGIAVTLEIDICLMFPVLGDTVFWGRKTC